MGGKLNYIQKQRIISAFIRRYRRPWNEFDYVSLYEALNPFDVIPNKEATHNKHKLENGFRLSKMGEDGYIGDI